MDVKGWRYRYFYLLLLLMGYGLLSGCKGQDKSNWECEVDTDCEIFMSGCSRTECIDHKCVQSIVESGPCSDGNLCTKGDMCTKGGICKGYPIVCPQPKDPCKVAVCLPDKGCVVQNAPDGKACDDHNQCTKGDKCVSGVCKGQNVCECSNDIDCKAKGFDLCKGPVYCIERRCVQDDSHPVECSTDLVCKVSKCNPETGKCEIEDAPDKTECNDDNICTADDWCEKGVCKGHRSACDDGLGCTKDLCDINTGACQHVPVADTCVIKGACYEPNDVDPDNPCRFCNPEKTQVDWTFKRNGFDLKNGKICYQGNVCDPVANCTGRECGDDGCGGSCGSCDGDTYCVHGKCKSPIKFVDVFQTTSDSDMINSVVATEDSLITGGYFDGTLYAGDYKLGSQDDSGFVIVLNKDDGAVRDAFKVGYKVDSMVNTSDGLYISGRNNSNVLHFKDRDIDLKGKGIFLLKFKNNSWAVDKATLFEKLSNDSDAYILGLMGVDGHLYASIMAFPDSPDTPVTVCGKEFSNEYNAVLAEIDKSRLKCKRIIKSIPCVGKFQVLDNKKGFFTGMFPKSVRIDGTTYTTKGEWDALNMVFDLNGSTRWVKTFGRTFVSLGGRAVKEDNDIITSVVLSFNPHHIVESESSTDILRIDSDGNIVWKMHLGAGIVDMNHFEFLLSNIYRVDNYIMSAGVIFPGESNDISGVGVPQIGSAGMFIFNPGDGKLAGYRWIGIPRVDSDHDIMRSTIIPVGIEDNRKDRIFVAGYVSGKGSVETNSFDIGENTNLFVIGYDRDALLEGLKGAL